MAIRFITLLMKSMKILPAELDGKANADASNVADHTAEWGAAIGTGVVEKGNGELVTGGTVYDAVKDKVDSDLGNLTDDGKNVIGDIAKDVFLLVTIIL